MYDFAPDPFEFSYIWVKFIFFFISVVYYSDKYKNWLI